MQTPWSIGALGQAEWEGPSLRNVLELAGLSDRAAWVAPVGLDHDNPEGESVRMCLPANKALDLDTIVALTMNGERLAPAHGAPARLVVPGWVGAYSIKWLDSIEVSSTWVSSHRADEYYVLRDELGGAVGPATAHPVKSNLALSWPAILPVGPNSIDGFARSGAAPVREVHWCLDDGGWHEAELLPPAGRWGWTPFRLETDLTAGDHVIRTRAIDASGATQPEIQPPHLDGVLWHAVTPHPITAR